MKSIKTNERTGRKTFPASTSWASIPSVVQLCDESKAPSPWKQQRIDVWLWQLWKTKVVPKNDSPFFSKHFFFPWKKTCFFLVGEVGMMMIWVFLRGARFFIEFGNKSPRFPFRYLSEGIFLFQLKSSMTRFELPVGRTLGGAKCGNFRNERTWSVSFFVLRHIWHICCISAWIILNVTLIPIYSIINIYYIQVNYLFQISGLWANPEIFKSIFFHHLSQLQTKHPASSKNLSFRAPNNNHQKVAVSPPSMEIAQHFDTRMACQGWWNSLGDFALRDLGFVEIWV